MMTIQKNLSAFAILACLFLLPVTPRLFADQANASETQYFEVQDEQIRVKEARAKELNYRIESLQHQIESERAESKTSQQKIWREFSDSLEVEKKDLQEKLNTLSERQARFENELSRKKDQDEMRIREKESQLEVLMRDVGRLRKELEVDRQSLQNLKKASETRRAEARLAAAAAPLPKDTEVLQNGAVRVASGSANDLLGGTSLARRDLQPEYNISIGDILTIEVWRSPDLSRRVTVRPDGRVSLPLAGDLNVMGMTLVDLRTVLTEKFSEYIRNPQVMISVEGFGGRKFVILGQISSPGVYRFQESLTLIEAIGLAGGFTEKAHTGKVMIIRGDIKKTPQVKIISVNAANIFKKGMISENISILPNDILYVGKDFMGDYNDFLDTVVGPSMDTAIDFFVLRSAIRTAQEKSS